MGSVDFCHTVPLENRSLREDNKLKYSYVKKILISTTLILTLGLSACGKKTTVEETASVESQSADSDAEAQEQAAKEAEEAARKAAEEEAAKAEEAARKEAEEQAAKEAEEEARKAEEEASQQVDRPALLSQLVILQDPSMYSYDQMLSDTEILKQLYPDLFTVDSIGTTADGRELVHYVVGNPNAENQIFINAAIHAREYLTFQLVMKQMTVYLQHVYDQDAWGDAAYQDMWQNVAIHVVPDINPDGVQISQFGLAGLQTDSIREGIYDIASMDGCEVTSSYLDHWKANAQGIDLNRNFDAYWEYYQDSGHPSSDHYKGTSPGSAPEAAALIQLTEANNFEYTISYHTQGHVIYWCFENMEPIYDDSSQWVSQIQAQTGYSPINDFSTVDPAGYSDWAIYRKQIPSVVIEVAVGESPYLADQFQQVWLENLNIWEMTVMRAMS